MNNWERSSVEVARILRQTAKQASGMPVEKITSAFDDAEQECLSLAQTDELKLEVKRRVAEKKLNLLCECNVSLDLVDEIRMCIHQFGFANLEMECRVELDYSQYCIRQGYYANAQQILQVLCSKLESAMKVEDLKVYPYLYGVANKFLSKIDKE